MKKQSHPKLIISLIITLLMVFLSSTKVFAGVSRIYSTLAGISVRVEKTIVQNGYSWGAYIGSYANQAIGTIGYTYWTIQEKCVPTGLTTYWVQYPGAVNYSATQYYNGATINYRACSGQRRLSHSGNHDLKQGGSVWQPYLERVENR